MRRRFPLAIVFSLAAGAALGGPPAAAEPAGTTPTQERLRLDYDVHVGGLYSMHITIDLALEEGRYRMAADLESDGLVALFSDFRLRSEVEGLYDGTSFAPLAYSADYRKGSKHRWVTLSYSGDGQQEAVAVPDAGDDKRAPVTGDDSLGAIDPLTGLLWMANRIADEGRCASEKLLYDGRRLYRMTAVDGVVPTPSGGARAAEFGATHHCDVTLARLKGFKQSEIDKLSIPEFLAIDLAPVMPGGPMIPVYVETETGDGPTRMTLVKVREMAAEAADDAVAGDPPRTAR